MCACKNNQRTWASYQIRKIASCACAGNARNIFPRGPLQRKPLVIDPGMHHGTCVTGESVPGIPGACAPAILRIWEEAHEAKNAGTRRSRGVTDSTVVTSKCQAWKGRPWRPWWNEYSMIVSVGLFARPGHEITCKKLNSVCVRVDIDLCHPWAICQWFSLI